METPVYHLHNRAIEGEPLTPDEHAQLNTWYAQQDAAEAVSLRETSRPTIAALRTELAASLKRLAAISSRIAALSEENEALRRANAALQQELIAGLTRKAA